MENIQYMKIKDLTPGLESVNLECIVLERGHFNKTKNGREVRTFKVADDTACINMAVWDETGKCVAPADIIRLNNVWSRIWRDRLTIYVTRDGQLKKFGEFCMVFNESVDMSAPFRFDKPQSSQGAQAKGAAGEEKPSGSRRTGSYDASKGKCARNNTNTR